GRRRGARRARAGRRPHGPGPWPPARRRDRRPEVPGRPRRRARAGPQARRLAGRSGGEVTRATITPAAPTQFSRVMGLGAVRGELVVTNDDIAGPIDSSDEWIRQRTGIVPRRRATGPRGVT